jgi:hypothetical protein
MCKRDGRFLVIIAPSTRVKLADLQARYTLAERMCSHGLPLHVMHGKALDVMHVLACHAARNRARM